MLDTNHLKEVDQNYFQHLLFALWISVRIGISAALLLIHGFLPFLKMPRALDIGRTSDFLFDKDYEVRIRQMKAMDKDVSDPK